MTTNQSIATLLGNIRNLLCFHKELGISHYPLSRNLQTFLARQPETPDNRKESGKRQPAGKKAFSKQADNRPSEMLLDLLKEEASGCKACPLAEKRLGVVPGSGPETARLMLVGDWSRQTNDFSAKTLFGAAEDEMLWRMMNAIQLSAQSVFVTNCIKCCPMAGQLPDNDSERRCFSFLEKEITLVKPALICAMGDTAARLLLGSDAPMVRQRGRFRKYRLVPDNSIDIVATYHPDFLLRNPEMKAVAWRDLQAIQRYLKKVD
jgi:uracil-DNA glycosylase family 4